METDKQILQNIRGLFPLITCFEPSSDQTHNDDPIAILDLFIKKYNCTLLQDNSALNWVLAALKSTKPEFLKPPNVKWFAEYGCVLLQSVQSVGIVTLMLVCLDEWKFEMQGGRKRTHSCSSNLNANQSLYVGNFRTAEYDEFWKIFNTLFANRNQKIKLQAKATLGKGKQRNQKTPAMIQAVLLDALSQLVEKSDQLKSDQLTPARGGFTDVRLHTEGNVARNTTWPLTIAVLQIILESQGNQNLYYFIMAHLKLMCVEIMLKQAKQDNKINLDTVMQMLKATINDGQNLTDIRDFETKCSNIRSSIDLIIQERTKTRANIFMLPKLYDETLYRDPILQIQSQENNPPNVTMNLNQAKKMAISNIGWIFAPLIFKNWSELSQWLAKPELKQKTNNCMLLVMNTVEKFAYDKAQKFEFQEHLPELQQVKVVVELYLLTVASFLEKKPMFALLTVEIRSRETLVVWIAASIARFVTAKYDPIQIISEYKSALNWKDLRHLVLSEKLAVDAAMYIAAYLRKTDNAASKSNVFLPQSQDTTMDFAERYAILSYNMFQTWQKEETEAANAQQTHWDQILEKQALLVKLDKELIDLQQMLQQWQTKFYQTERPCNDEYNRYGTKIQSATSYENDVRYNEASQNVQQYLSKINYKQAEIVRTEVPPAGIVQPLPKKSNQALAVLFFMYMPENYDVLSNLMFLAQQMLLPKTDSVSIPDIGPVASFQKINVKEIIKVDNPKTVWRSHYSSHKRANLQQVVDPQVVLGSHQEVKNGKWWPSNVREYKNPEQGVWHPDQLDKQLYWCGSDSKSSNIQNGKNINPFALIKNQVFVNTFTEMLPPEDQYMQWAMEQHGYQSQHNRQNWPEAVQDRIIKGKNQHLAFSALRAYPNQQLRKLCVALRDRTLQLDTQLVHTLLRQTFYHLGDFSDEDLPTLLWWTDFEIQNDGRATFRNELKELCEELQCMPRMHMAILILGELAAITSQWDPEARDLARRYAKIAINWAENLDSEIQSAETDQVAELRARRCIFSMYALVCHSAGYLTKDDVYKILKLVMIIENSRLVQETTSYDNQIRFLTVVTQNVMARRLTAILILLDKHSEILTESSKLILEQTPSNLLWIRVKAPDGSVTQCYEAVSLTNDLYSLNVQTGVLLFNGLPPRRLPASMLALSLYKRSFGDRNFEVVVTMDNIFKTTRRVMNSSGNGYFYEFFVDKNGKLVVREIDEKRSQTLELLDGTEEGFKAWASDLPIRLQKMHSHWYCRNTSTIVLRNVIFDEHEVSFVCIKQDFFRVQENDAKCHWMDLCKEEKIKSLDRLVIEKSQNSCPVVNIFKKFETDRKLIHVFFEGDSRKALIFELPRFDLSFSFSLNQGENYEIQSNNYRDFSLSRQQLMIDTLMGFCQYLILESKIGAQMILIPSGTVQLGAEVIGSNYCDAERKHHSYKCHPRFGTLEVQAGPLALEARLQLSALYAATDSEVPLKRSHQTGGEMAVELLRQSWINRPMTDREYGHLQSILNFSQFSPTLPLLCLEIDKSARELQFLHPEKPQNPPITLNIDAASQYTQLKQRSQLNPRAIMSQDEERRVLALPVDIRQRGFIQIDKEIIQVTKEIDQIRKSCRSEICKSMIVNINEELRKMVRKQMCDENSKFPLNASDFQQSKIGQSIIGKLQESWEAYQKRETVYLIKSLEDLQNQFCEMQDQIRQARTNLESDLITSINYVPLGTSLAFFMRRAANMEPLATLVDLARSAFLPNSLKKFNPFLSKATYQKLHDDILVWLQICVLEDKVRRMYHLTESKNSQEIERELCNIDRMWDVYEHPEWLVFEVEQGVQIREIQYVVAKYLIDNPGAITQLNMGEGKTRIILPMIILAMKDPELLIRLHFLSPLLGEAYDYLHRHLTASLANIKLCLVPFHRDMEIRECDAMLLFHSLKRLKSQFGAMCIAPEHRLSMELKQQELRTNTNAEIQNVCNLLKSIEELQYYDIIDESDEVLRHKYQLIYAVGSCRQLPDGKDRWIACQAILKQLHYNSQVAEILKQQDVSKRESVQIERGSGCFDKIRLLPGPALDQYSKRLIEVISEGIIVDPPYHMRWLKDNSHKQIIVQFITDLLIDLEWVLQKKLEINETQINQLLALRGFLACGIMERCLIARHRVDYGIDQRRGIGRRVAVPYRASDTPSERAEYKHPEILILKTTLSYFHDGISRSEIKEGATVLLSLGPIAQKVEYNLWFESAKQTMAGNPKHIAALDNVDKIDLTNESQLDLLHEAFRYNMAAIEFWLNNCVFPRETMQFPQSLVKNAFNLAKNQTRNVIGFSGTKDNYLLLPLQVKQHMEVNNVLIATDGMMLDLVGPKNDQVVEIIPSSVSLSTAVLEYAAVNFNALIDAGATMVGLSNSEVAKRILELLPQSSTLKGAVYFEVSENTWYLINKRGRSWPLGNSPIHECEAFVYFDESRCRGADMKLSSSATAVLTIGSQMCKDKIMQAAGRMRKLQYGQKITFVVPQELVPKIRASESVNLLKPLQVLNWVMKNTIQATIDGLFEWGAQGIHFATTFDPKARFIDENLELKDLYSSLVNENTIHQVLVDREKSQITRIEKLGINQVGQDSSLLKSIIVHSEQYGSDVKIKFVVLEEECERELELERELQQEVEKQIPRQKPANPQKWPFSSILTATRPNDLPSSARVFKLKDVFFLHFDPCLALIQWDENIYVTQNFISTVTQNDGALLKDLSEYMRPIDAVALFKNQECLLLSEWEADEILKIMWENTSASVSMCSFSYLIKSADGDWNLAPKLLVPIQQKNKENQILKKKQKKKDKKKNGMEFEIKDNTLTALNLFAGGTMFTTDLFKKALKYLMPTPEAKKAALKLPGLRGRPQMIPRSDLEIFCTDKMDK